MNVPLNLLTMKKVLADCSFVTHWSINMMSCYFSKDSFDTRLHSCFVLAFQALNPFFDALEV
jgi:hypothetical protein